jgi:hypothetical protein
MQFLQNLVATEVVDVLSINTFLDGLHAINETPRDTREVSRARLSKHMFASGTITTVDSQNQPLSMTLTRLNL